MARLAQLVALILLTAACGTGAPPSMPIGSPAPAFSLPGIDGRTHSLADYASSRVLALVFTCNHCPASQLYEARLAKLYEDYRNRGVAVVAINPNSPKALRLDELSHTDVGESLDDMKTRAAHRHLEYPYLADGETLAKQLKVVATPQIFVFDQARTLRYQGRIDNHLREDAVTARDARNAIDALLAGRSVPVAETAATGCPPTFLSKPGGPEAEQAAIAAEPVKLEMVGADGLKALRQNGTGKLLLVNFWATWCAPCVSEFPDLEATYRMYRGRNVDFVDRVDQRSSGEGRRPRVPGEAPRVPSQSAVRDDGRLRFAGGVRPEDARAGPVHAAPCAKRRRALSGARRLGHSEAAASHSGESA